MPGSFSLEESKTTASIYYSVSAKLIGNNNTLKDKENIFILQNFTDSQTDARIEKNFMLKYCCWKKGELKLNALFPKNEFYMNECIKFCVEVDNSLGGLIVERIYARLYCNFWSLATLIVGNFLKSKRYPRMKKLICLLEKNVKEITS